MKDLNKYKENSNQLVKLAIDRHLTDLEKSKQKDYPYIYDKKRAERAVKIAKLMRHTAGSVAGKPFILKWYMEFIISSIFGWVRKDTGKRRYRRIYVEMARKGVKSELAAVIAIIGLIFDNEPGAQVFTIATQKDQAKIVFGKAVFMIRSLQDESPRIKQAVRVMGGDRADRVICYTNNGFMEPFSAESRTKDGHDPHLVICDEYHAHKTDQLLNVMTSGMGARSQPLVVIITTAGFNIDSPCYEEREVVVNILKGLTENDTIFGMIFTLDEGDDWKDRDVWVKAAPNIGETPTWDFMESEFKKALEGISKEIEFKTKLLNIWTSGSEEWIREDELTYRKYKIEDLKGMTAIGGLDLAYARSGDIVAYTLFFPEIGHFITYYFCSTEKAENVRSDGVNYAQWVRDGYIAAIEGNTIDYDYIEKKIYELAEIVDTKAIVYDRFNSSQLIINLTDAGLLTIPFGQTFSYMDTPTKEMERLTKMGKLTFDDNPVTKWMFRNAVLLIDSNANVKISRGNKKKKVDGVITKIMALAGSLDKKLTQNVYTGSGPVAL